MNLGRPVRPARPARPDLPPIDDRLPLGPERDARAAGAGVLPPLATLLLGTQCATAAIALGVAVAMAVAAIGQERRWVAPLASDLAPRLPALAALAVGLVALAALSHADRIRRRLRAENRDLEIAAYSDALTGLGNRRSFEQGLRACWLAAARDGHTPCLLLVDADHFKLFNDSFGHGEGDRLLEAVGRTLEAVLEPGTGRAYRQGGEEFALLLPQGGIEAGREVARQAMAAIVALARPHPRAPSGCFTVSIGLAEAMPDRRPGGLEQLVRAADDALYRAKRDGRGCVREAGAAPTPAATFRRAAELPEPAAAPLERIAGVEIVLGNGRLIRIPQAIDPLAVAEIARLIGRE